MPRHPAFIESAYRLQGYGRSVGDDVFLALLAVVDQLVLPLLGREQDAGPLRRDFAAGGVTTSFIETHPELLSARHSADRGTRLLSYLADITINKPYGPRPAGLLEPHLKLPAVDLKHPAPPGTRQALVDLGPEGFARRLREAAYPLPGDGWPSLPWPAF